MSHCCGSIRGGGGGAGGEPNWIQSASEPIPADLISQTPARSTLATLNITTGTGFLLIWATLGLAADDAPDRGLFWIVVDTVDVLSRTITAPFGTVAIPAADTWYVEVSMAFRIPVVAGLHTVSIQAQKLFSATSLLTIDGGQLIVAEVLT